MNKKLLRTTILGLVAMLLLLVSNPQLQSLPAAAQVPKQNPSQLNKQEVSSVVLNNHPGRKVDKVVIQDGYALASWVQGEGGGTTLLHLKGGKWTILTQGGGAIGMPEMKKYKVPQATAKKLLDGLDPTWRQNTGF
jgi:hypothetical protein